MNPRNQILTAADVERMPGERKVHNQNPNAVRSNKSLGDAVGLSNLGVHRIEIEPGRESTEYHAHHFEEECVYVLSGHATVTIGEDRIGIGPGDFVGYPCNGLAHTMENTGDETLVCLVVGQRLAQDVADYPRKRKRLFRHDGHWDLADHDALVDPRK